MEQEKSLFKVILEVLKKRFKFRHLLFLALLMTVNTFAWFIYMDKVSSDLEVKVKAWNVSFKFDNTTMTDYVNFRITEIYPGMEDNRQTLTVSNGGEVNANFNYQIVYANILGTVYDTENGNITEEELTNKLANDYPFKIVLSASNNIISKGGNSEYFYVDVTWDYETTNSNGTLNDSEDTYWGNLAYSYINTHPSVPCIELRIKLTATQINN